MQTPRLLSVAAVFATLLSGCSLKHGLEPSCLDHLTRIDQAVRLEASRHKVSARSLPQVLARRFGTEWAILSTCPSSGQSYRFNVALNELTEKRLGELKGVPLVFDSSFPHNGKARILYCDGDTDDVEATEFNKVCSKLKAEGLFRIRSF